MKVIWDAKRTDSIWIGIGSKSDEELVLVQYSGKEVILDLYKNYTGAYWAPGTFSDYGSGCMNQTLQY